MIVDASADWAAWVQAVGTIAAVLGAAWVAAGDARAARRRDERQRTEAQEHAAQAKHASRLAAYNLAILAVERLKELHALLQDDARRERVVRMSPSRTLIVTETMLAAFPLQSLEDAPSMVAFSYFPGLLATAAEVYGNLETEIRACDDDADRRKAVFETFAEDIARHERVGRRRLTELKAALKIEDPAIALEHVVIDAAPRAKPHYPHRAKP